MYQAAFDPSPPSPKKDNKAANGTNGKEKPKSTEKKVEKPKTPITLSQAVKENLRVEDLKNLLEMSQTRFPDSPLPGSGTSPRISTKNLSTPTKMSSQTL